MEQLCYRTLKRTAGISRTRLTPYKFHAYLLPALLLFLAAADSVMAESHHSEFVASGVIQRGDFSIRARLPLSTDLVPFLRSTLDSAEIDAFLREGELIYVHGDQFLPELLIGNKAAAQELSRRHKERGSNVAVEILMALELSPQLSNTMSDTELELHIFNALHRVSTLSGLQYFSPSRGEMVTFYINTSVVNRKDGITVLPDPVFPRLQESYKFVVRLEDGSFGSNLYEVHTSPGTIRIQNISTMFYGILPIAGPDDLEIQLSVYKEGDYLLFYALSSIYALDIFGIHERIRDGFYNRMVALYNWFIRTLPQQDS